MASQFPPCPLLLCFAILCGFLCGCTPSQQGERGRESVLPPKEAQTERGKTHLEPPVEPAKERSSEGGREPLREVPPELREEGRKERLREPLPEPQREEIADAGDGGLERTTPDWSMPEDQVLEKVPSRIQWASLQWPPSVSVKAGQTSRVIYGQVYVRGVTDVIRGATPSLRAELGVGPWGTTPQSQPSRWVWVRATYAKNAGVGGNNHEYSATLRLSKPGLYQYAYRFSLNRGPWQVADRSDFGRRGTDDGVRLKDLGVAVAIRAGATLRIGAMNLHCFVEAPDQRFAELARQWSTLQLDVIGLQEVCAPSKGGKNSAELLAARLQKEGAGRFRALFVPTHTATHRGVSYQEGIGLLTRLPVLESKAVALPSLGQRPAGAFPRKLLWARLASPLGVVSIGSVHLSYRRDHEAWRTRQVETLKKAMTSSETWASSRFVVGDFNASPGATPLQTMRSAGKPAGTPAFLDLLSGVDVGPTFPARAPSVRIDYLFSTPPPATLPWSVKSASRLFLKPLPSGVYLSDHLGLRVTLVAR